MKKKPASKSAFFNPRVLISFAFLCGVILALLVFGYPGTSTALANKAMEAVLQASAAPIQLEQLQNRPEVVLDETRSQVLMDEAAVHQAAKMSALARREAAVNSNPPHVPDVAPANDTCAGAEVIPGAGPFPLLTAVTADITDATVTGNPPTPSCQASISRSIWYTFTPTVSNIYKISSCANAPTGTTVDDTVMAIYTSTGGCAGPFTQIPTGGYTNGCDDDSCGTEDLQAITSAALTAGTQYYIVMWQFGTTAPTVGNTAVQLRVLDWNASSERQLRRCDRTAP